MRRSGVPVEGVPLVAGAAGGRCLVLDEPLSFWGGADPTSGRVTDTHHPQVGEVVAGRVLVLPRGRGSSSSSSVLAEMIRNRVGPAAILLAAADPIIAIGCLVAGELYGTQTPVVVLDAAAYARCAAAAELTVEATEDRAVIHVGA